MKANKRSNSRAGYHRFGADGETYGSFQVFWSSRNSGAGLMGEDNRPMPAGWYWWACFPGCMPDGDPVGPFAGSYSAWRDARDSDG